MGRWGRQSPVEPVDPPPPPLPPRKSITRQSSFTKLGQILNPNKNSTTKKQQVASEYTKVISLHYQLLFVHQLEMLNYL